MFEIAYFASSMLFFGTVFLSRVAKAFVLHTWVNAEIMKAFRPPVRLLYIYTIKIKISNQDSTRFGRRNFLFVCKRGQLLFLNVNIAFIILFENTV